MAAASANNSTAKKILKCLRCCSDNGGGFDNLARRGRLGGCLRYSNTIGRAMLTPLRL